MPAGNPLYGTFVSIGHWSQFNTDSYLTESYKANYKVPKRCKSYCRFVKRFMQNLPWNVTPGGREGFFYSN